MAEIKGFDISTHQGRVDWNLIQQAYDRGEIGFVILRAGYGGGGVDGQFARNWHEARQRNIPHQAYFFAYPGRSGGADQAREFFSIVGALQTGESVSLDMEDEPSYGRRLVASDVQWSLDFLNTARNLFGVKPLLYLNSDLLTRFNWEPVKAGDFGLWLANYGPNNGQPNTRPTPGIWPFWAIWQYTSKANLAGISPLDMNIFSGDKAAFLRYGKQDGVAPVSTPIPMPAPAPQPESGKYTLHKDLAGYVNAGDAAARRNSNSTAPAGTLFVFNQAQGMINVTRVAGQPGWWINPSDNNGVAAPASETRIVVPSGPSGFLGNIASQYGSTVAQIVNWNKSKYPSISPNYVQAGWNIRVK